MNAEVKLLRRGTIHGLTGMTTCMALAGLLIWIVRIHTGTGAWHVFWPCLAGMIVWGHLVATYILLAHEARHAPLPNGVPSSASESSPTAIGKIRLRFVHRFYFRFLLPALELGATLLLAQSLLFELGMRPTTVEAMEPNKLLLIAVYSITALVLIILSVYITNLMQARTWHLLKAGRNLNNLFAALFVCLLAAACGEHFGFTGLTAVTDWVLITVNTLLAAEILISMVLRFFSPRQPSAMPRPAFDFYLLEGLAQPDRIGQTFAAMLESLFGFDIARSSFGKIVQSMILPAFCITIGLLLGLSTIVIIKPNEQALVLNLGRLRPQPLQPGLHLKLPWPLASIRRYDVAAIRNIHVGSHKPGRTDGSVYREGVPILWTNMHGLNIDELLICSSPQEETQSQESGRSRKADTHKVPSVSLAAADVHIQYVIDDLVTYASTTAAPEVLLKKTAETQASRLIYRYDIDALFTKARRDLVDDIRKAVQEACNEHRLGVSIIHVAITAAHPPVEVAADFEATVVAMQEKETRIQQARQTAVRTQVETTGSAETFARLAGLADQVDFQQGEDVTGYENLLHDCGGEVATILAAAESYRFSRENRERGTTERFVRQMHAYGASPLPYRYDKYLSVLEKGLAKNKKVVLLGDTDKTVVRIGIGAGSEMSLSPDEIDFQ